MGVRTLGQMGSANPLEKMDEKLKSENTQKSSFLCLCYILRAIRAGRCRERRYADHISDILQDTPFRSQIFKIFFASGEGGIDPLTKILRTFLEVPYGF